MQSECTLSRHICLLLLSLKHLCSWPLWSQQTGRCSGIESVCSFFFSAPPVQQGSCYCIFSPPSKLKHCRGSSWPWEINMGGLALLWGSPIEATSPPNPQLKGIPRLLRRNSNIPASRAFTRRYPDMNQHIKHVISFRLFNLEMLSLWQV